MAPFVQNRRLKVAKTALSAAIERLPVCLRHHQQGRLVWQQRALRRQTPFFLLHFYIDVRTIQVFETICLRKLFRIPYMEHNDCVQSRSTFCGSTGTSSSNCQETETCMVRAWHTPWQPLENYSSGHLGGWATPWSPEEMLQDNIKEWTFLPMPKLLTIASCRKDGKRFSAESPLCTPDDPIGQEIELNWTYKNYTKPADGNIYVKFYTFGSAGVFWFPNKGGRIVCVTYLLPRQFSITRHEIQVEGGRTACVTYPGSLSIMRHEMQVT